MNQSETVQTKTVIELDMRGYSDIARQRELDYGSPIAVAELNQEIQQFVDVGLKAVNLVREDVVKAVNGDNAVIVFDDPMQAHLFAEAVHKCTEEYNKNQQGLLAQRWFRIGCATGELHEENGTIAGIVIADAYRLEAAANPGEFLIDCHTYKYLKESLDHDPYLAAETVQGERDELFYNCRRWQVIERVSLLELMKNNLTIQSAINSYFNNLKNTHTMIKESDNYKRVHDKFQDLEKELKDINMFLPSIQSELTPKTSIKTWTNNYKSQDAKLNKSLKDIKKILEIENLEFGRYTDEWKTRITIIEKKLTEVIGQLTINRNVYRSCFLRIMENIDYLIYNPGMSFVNGLLVDSLKKLNLQQLISDLDNISESYSKECQIFDESQLKDINDNKNSISEINEKLIKLLNIHNDLQYLNDRMRNTNNELNKMDSRFGEDQESKDESRKMLLDAWDKILYRQIQKIFVEEPNSKYSANIKEILKHAHKVNDRRLNDDTSLKDKLEQFQTEFVDLVEPISLYFLQVDKDLLELIQSELISKFDMLQEPNAVLDKSKIQSL